MIEKEAQSRNLAEHSSNDKGVSPLSWLGGTQWAKGKVDKALSARLSRHLRLLRDHRVIRKLPKQNRYQLTDKRRKLTMLISVLLGASTEQLL